MQKQYDENCKMYKFNNLIDVAFTTMYINEESAESAEFGI